MTLDLSRYDQADLEALYAGHVSLANAYKDGGQYALAHYHDGVSVQVAVELSIRRRMQEKAQDAQLLLDVDVPGAGPPWG